MSVGEWAIIKAVGDIGNITEELICDESGRILIVEGEIIGILKTDVYLDYRICNSKVTEVGNIDECTKCGAKVKIRKCKAKQIARVLILDANDKEHKVTMFEEMIQQVLGFSKASGDFDDIDDKPLASPCLK